MQGKTAELSYHALHAKSQDALDEGLSQQCMYCKSLWVKKGTQLKSDSTPIS